MMLNLHRNHEAYQGRGEGGGKGVWRSGKREIIYLSLHCHHQNDFCIKPVLNGANVCSPEHTSDTSTNYDSFLN